MAEKNQTEYWGNEEVKQQFWLKMSLMLHGMQRKVFQCAKTDEVHNLLNLILH